MHEPIEDRLRKMHDLDNKNVYFQIYMVPKVSVSTPKFTVNLLVYEWIDAFVRKQLA